MIKIDTRYVRRSPEGDESIVKVNNATDAAYHESLQAEGYTYTEVVVHAMKQECESCSA